MKQISKFESHKQELPIKKLPEFQEQLALNRSLKNCTIHTLDFRAHELDWASIELKNTVFLGCQFKVADELHLIERGALIFAQPEGLPYDPYRKSLYTWQELMEGYQPSQDDSIDKKIYDHFVQTKFTPPIKEALYQRIHDHSIDEALRDLIQYNEAGMTHLKCVGFMGGHSTPRTDPFFRKTAETAKLLSEHGYFVVSGGGPGIMEATNLGAYLAGQSGAALDEALDLLVQAPHYTDEGYQVQARKVLEHFPEGQPSLAIPTWFYGHEPSNLFASSIAKYFSNSIREDTLLAICLYGIVFAPGSAGTTQEIFQDATQNHYGTFNYYSPMVFLGKKRYEVDTMIYPLLRQLAHEKTYKELLFLTDEPEEVLRFLGETGPVPIPNPSLYREGNQL